MSLRYLGSVGALLVAALVLSAADEEKGDHGPTKAVCVLHHTKNNKAHGVVHFIQDGHTVHITGKISGLTPGQHAFHVHEFGDESSPDAMAAGGHFNPGKKPHGGPHDEERHAGDLGNIEAGEDGTANIDITDKMISLHGPHSIIGRSLIVHAKPDDFKTQNPPGNAGPRVACGVIGIGKAEK